MKKAILFPILFLFLSLGFSLFTPAFAATEDSYLKSLPSDRKSWLTSDLYAVQEYAGWGVYNTYSSRWICRPEYDEISSMGNDYLKVRKIGSYGVIKTNCSIVVPITYSDVNLLIDDYFSITQNGVVGVSKGGIVIATPQFDNISLLTGNLFKIRNYGFWGIMAKSGNIVMNPQFDDIKALESVYFIVRNNGVQKVIDVTGKERFQNHFRSISVMENYSPYFKVNNGRNNVGIIDKDGKIIVPLTFEKVNKGSKDLNYFKVKKDGKWGVYDITGKQVYPCSYGPLEINKLIKNIPYNTDVAIKHEMDWGHLYTLGAYVEIQNETYSQANKTLRKVFNSFDLYEETKELALSLKPQLSAQGYSLPSPMWKTNKAANTASSSNQQSTAAKAATTNTTTITTAKKTTTNTSTASTNLKLKQAKLCYQNQRYNNALTFLNQLINDPQTDKNTLKEAYDLRYTIRMYHTNDEAGAEEDYKKMQSL